MNSRTLLDCLVFPVVLQLAAGASAQAPAPVAPIPPAPVVVVVPAPVAAAPTPPEPRFEASMNAAFFYRGYENGGSIGAFSPEVDAVARIAANGRMHAGASFAHVTIADGVERIEGRRAGTIWLGGAYRFAPPNWTIWLGGEGAVRPVWRMLDSTDDLALGAAITTRGMWNAWRYTAPAALAITAKAVHVDGVARYTGESAIATVADEEAWQVLAQSGVEAAADLGVFAIGVRARQVSLLRSGPDTQYSLEPFAELDSGAVFFDAAFTMNLSGPAGFAFADDGFWGLRLGMGGRI